MKGHADLELNIVGVYFTESKNGIGKRGLF